MTKNTWKGLHDFILRQTLTYFNINDYWLFTFSEFDSLIGISVGITSSAAAIKICVITAGTKKLSQLSRKEVEAW